MIICLDWQLKHSPSIRADLPAGWSLAGFLPKTEIEPFYI
ncbi:Unknown protein sequence [Pseudomonas coronafaciens pv. oryzae]|nr:Unknown protein sequence [Pseudomonas coronafaciens pv. oryzae]